MQTGDGFITMGDGVRLYFEQLGSGPKAVIIPNGFHLLDDFRHLGAWRTLIFYDVRNRGRSDTVTDPRSSREASSRTWTILTQSAGILESNMPT